MNDRPRTGMQLDRGEFPPAQVVEVEISAPIPPLAARDAATGAVYARAVSLVRLHTMPLGVLDIPVPPRGLSPQEYAGLIWAELGAQINRHLGADRWPSVAGLDPAGLPAPVEPPCQRPRRAILAAAPFVSVIVATRDRPDDLARCLDSLLALEYPSYEVLVVDNAPRTSATADLVADRYADTPVRYVREDRPGLSNARNRALREVRGEIAAFTDDDVRADRYWLADLVAGFGVTDRVGGVTGSVLAAELDTPGQQMFEQFGGFHKGFERRVYDLEECRADSPLFPYAAGRFGSGNNMAFRAPLLREMGGFDPNLGAGTRTRGGEDLAAFVETLLRGLRLVYEPSSIVFHRHRRDYTALAGQMYGYGTGLSAYLTKLVVDHPALAVDVARRTVPGLIHALNPGSAKNAQKGAAYPRELTHLERKGWLHGPALYLMGRFLSR